MLLFSAFEMIRPVYFLKWKLVTVMETKCTSSMYFEFHFVFYKIEGTDCNRGKVHISLYLVFHFAKWRLLIVTEKGRPLPLEQESRVCPVLNPPEVEPPRSYHLCDFFYNF